MLRKFLFGILLVVFVLTSASVLTASAGNNSGRLPAEVKKMQSGEIKTISIHFQNKSKRISNVHRVNSIKEILNFKYCVRTPKKDSGKGWIYAIKGKNKRGGTISEIVIINSKYISINGKTYKVSKLKLNKIRYFLNNGNKTPLLQSKRIRYLVVQFRGKYKIIKSRIKIKRLKAIFAHLRIRPTKNSDGKGWIYRIKAKDAKGRTVEEITIIGKKRIMYMGDIYGCRINLKKLDRLFNINRSA